MVVGISCRAVANSVITALPMPRKEMYASEAVGML